MKQAPLQTYERNLTSLFFLRTIASSILLVLLFVLLPLFAFNISYDFVGFFLPFDFLQSTSTPVKVTATIVFAAVIGPWLWALARVRPRTIAVYSAVIGALLVLAQFAILIVVLHESSFASARHITSSIVRLTFTIIGAFVSFSFAWYIIKDGCLAKYEQGHPLLVAAEPGLAGSGEVIQAALGIEPECSWLPRWWQRLATRTLFLLASIGRGLTVFLLILLLIPFRIKGVTISDGADLSLQQLGDPLTQLYGDLGPVGDILARATVIALCRGLLIVAAIIARYFARRLARVSAETLLQEDKRPPVLFLRSFHDDQVHLTWGSRGRFRDWVAFGEPSPSLDHLVLYGAIPLGPVVAIGRPGAPVPFGISRTYVSDDAWQSEVMHLAEVAKVIVIVLDDTAGVKWEAHHVQSGRTLYLIPPRFASPELATELLKEHLIKLSPPNDDTRDGTSDVELTCSCIGWYLNKESEVIVLTCENATATAYVIALRLYAIDQTRELSVTVNELEFKERHKNEKKLARQIDTLFQTERGIVVLLKDGSAMAQANGEYRLFDSASEYRELFNDNEPWDEIKDSEQFKSFLHTHGGLFEFST